MSQSESIARLNFLLLHLFALVLTYHFFASFIIVLLESLDKEKQNTAIDFDGYELNESATWHSSLAPQRNLYLNSPNKC